MKFLHAVAITLIIILIVVLIYNLIKSTKNDVDVNYLLANYVENPWKVYQRSSGTFDEAAALALCRATERDTLSSENHILAATVMTRNILLQEHEPIFDRAGQIDDRSIERSRLRRIIFDEAREHYRAALQGLNTYRPQNNINNAFIIDAAAGFAFNGVAELLANDPILTTLEWGTIPEYYIDYPLVDIVTEQRENLTAEHRAVAKNIVDKQGGALGAGVDAYVELAIQNTDDPQNTHDTGVLACLKAIIERLRLDQQSQDLPSLDKIIEAIKYEDLADGNTRKLNDVIQVIDRVKLGQRVIAIGATDSECLARIWLRTTDPKNSDVRVKLRQATFDALYDCWEDGMTSHIVCVNGRTARILSVLTLLDHDKRNWEIKKFEQFKNDIFIKAAKVIEMEAEDAIKSTDTNMQQAGKLWRAKTAAEFKLIGDVPEIYQEQLADKMRNSIDKMVYDYINELESSLDVKNAIPSYMVDAIITEAKAAV